MTIRDLLADDWLAVKEIYEFGIATGIATFEKEAPTWAKWDENHLAFSRKVATIDGLVVGWVALSPVSSRCVYAGVAEVSIYVHPAFKGQQVGKVLLKNAIEDSETHGIWTLNASTFPENIASRSLLQKLGFREIGYREKIALKNDVWKDNIILERRSELSKFN